MQVAEYRLSGTAAHLVAQLEQATVADKQAERKAHRLGVAAAISAALGFGACFVTSAFGQPPYFTALLLVAAIVLLVVRARVKRFDLDDRRLGAALRLVKVLRADIPASSTIQLHLDFRPYRKGGTQTSKEGGVLGPRVEHYEQGWLDLRTRLADGNALSVSVKERVTRRTKPKRKYNKVTERISDLVVFLVRLDKRYGAAEPVVARLQTRGPSGQVVVKRAAARGRAMKVVLATPVAVAVSGRSNTRRGFETLATGDTLLQGLRWIYGGIGGAPKAA